MDFVHQVSGKAEENSCGSGSPSYPVFGRAQEDQFLQKSLCSVLLLSFKVFVFDHDKLH
jgi:hypothetical protein